MWLDYGLPAGLVTFELGHPFPANSKSAHREKLRTAQSGGVEGEGDADEGDADEEGDAEDDGEPAAAPASSSPASSRSHSAWAEAIVSLGAVRCEKNEVPLLRCKAARVATALGNPARRLSADARSRAQGNFRARAVCSPNQSLNLPVSAALPTRVTRRCILLSSSRSASLWSAWPSSSTPRRRPHWTRRRPLRRRRMADEAQKEAEEAAAKAAASPYNELLQHMAADAAAAATAAQAAVKGRFLPTARDGECVFFSGGVSGAQGRSGQRDNGRDSAKPELLVLKGVDLSRGLRVEAGRGQARRGRARPARLLHELYAARVLRLQLSRWQGRAAAAQGLPGRPAPLLASF